MRTLFSAVVLPALLLMGGCAMESGKEPVKLPPKQSSCLRDQEALHFSEFASSAEAVDAFAKASRACGSSYEEVMTQARALQETGVYVRNETGGNQ